MLARQHQHQPRAGRRATTARRPPSLSRSHVAVVRASTNNSRDPFAATAKAPAPAPANAANAANANAADTDHHPPSVTALPASMQPFGRKTWLWRGHRCSYVTAGCGQQSVVLVHGFGASATQWRRVFQALVDHGGYKVYAPDLLGFGASDMPLPSEASPDKDGHFYRLELWRDQIADFCREFVGAGGDGGSSSSGRDDASAQQPPGPVLIGNSVGSLSCLMAAAGPVSASGVVLLNTAGALNNKGVVSDWRIVLAYPIFLLVDLLLSIRPIAQRLFDGVRDPENLANVLKGAYGDAEGGKGVDDELVSLVSGPAARPGALDVFVDVVTSPHHGPKPWDLVPELRKKGTPLLVAWGTDDRLTPVDGPVGRYFRALAAEEEEEGDSLKGVTFALLEGHGHCPHDDPRPTLARDHLLPWLAALRGRSDGESVEDEEEEAKVAATARATAA